MEITVGLMAEGGVAASEGAFLLQSAQPSRGSRISFDIPGQ